MPRAGLSREAVTALAVELVDERQVGLDGLTLAAVAARAGVAVPSLYKHVGSLDDLRRAVAVVGLQELQRAASAATVGRSGEDALRSLGRAVRAFGRAHPGLYAATQVAPHPGEPGSDEHLRAAESLVDVIAAVLRGFALPEPALVPAVRAVRSAVHGFVDLELHGGFGMPEDLDTSFEALLAVLVAGLAAAA